VPSPPPGPSPEAPGRRRAIVVAFACFAIALAGLVLGYLALTIPDAWFGAAAPKTFGPRSLAIAVGNGTIEGDALVATPGDASGTIIVTIPAVLSAAQYRGIAWHVAGLPAGTEARLLWRSEVRPGRTFTLPIQQEADRLAPVVASRDANWLGRITGIALALRVPTGEPVRISGMSVDPLTLSTVLAAWVRDWTAFEGWSGASINTVVGGADLPGLSLPALLGLAVVLAAAFAVALARFRPNWVGAGLPLALALVFVAAWLVLDLRWQWNLGRQTAVTARTYAGKDWRAKHEAAEDGPLFAFIEKARAKLPAAPARVFVLAEAHYFRGRAAYHLYPQNVWFDPWVNSAPPAAALRPGDYVVVYLRRGVQYDAAQGLLRWDGGEPVSAEVLVVDPGAALFRIR
jgi:hypothetical protein